MVFECLDNFLCFSLSSRTGHYETTQCHFSVGLVRTLCAFVSLTIDNILQQYVPRNTVTKFYPNCFLLLLWKISDQMYHRISTILEARQILQVVSHFNLSVLADETLSVSLCREIDNVFGALGTCFDHVLSKFSGFSWEHILFLKSACVDKGWCKFKFKLEALKESFYESAWECWEFKKKLHFAWDPQTRFMDFGLLYENNEGEYVVLNDVRNADIRLASLVYLPCLR